MQEYSGDHTSQEKEIHLSEYLMVLQKRRRLIILVCILTLLAAGLYLSFVVPVYQSSTMLIVDREKSKSPITGESLDTGSYASDQISFDTSMKMIKTSAVLDEVVAALNLDARDPEQAKEDLEISFIREWWTKIKANIKRLLKSFLAEKKEKALPLPPSVVEDLRRQSLVAILKQKIKVEQVRGTRLLEISVRDRDPVLAADIANTVAVRFMEFNVANRVAASKQNLEWLNKELYELRKKLEDDEQKFFDYKQKNLVFSIEGKQKQAEQKIQEFNARYLETRNRRLELDAKIDELSRNMGSIKSVANVRSLINNPVIESIYARIIDLEIELTQLSRVYGPKHPQIVRAETELEKSRSSLALEISKELENLKSEREVLYVREKTLEKNIAEFERDALDTSAKELQYTILQRNVDTSRNLYDLMLSRIKESDILQTASTDHIRLVEKAKVPRGPIHPDKRRTLLIAVVLGLVAGCGLAFFIEYMDRTVRTEEDFRQHFNIPVLSVVPKADRSVSYGADY